MNVLSPWEAWRKRDIAAGKRETICCWRVKRLWRRLIRLLNVTNLRLNARSNIKGLKCSLLLDFACPLEKTFALVHAGSHISYFTSVQFLWDDLQRFKLWRHAEHRFHSVFIAFQWNLNTQAYIKAAHIDFVQWRPTGCKLNSDMFWPHLELMLLVT